MKTGTSRRNGETVLEAQCEQCGEEFEEAATSVADEEEQLRYRLDCERAFTEEATTQWLEQGELGR